MTRVAISSLNEASELGLLKTKKSQNFWHTLRFLSKIPPIGLLLTAAVPFKETWETSNMQIQKEWFAATLADAYEALGEAVEMLETGDLEDAEDVLNNRLLHVYAKLNYAVNTARLGEAGLETLPEDALIAWPEEMPFTYEPDAQAYEDALDADSSASGNHSKN